MMMTVYKDCIVLLKMMMLLEVLNKINLLLNLTYQKFCELPKMYPILI